MSLLRRLRRATWLKCTVLLLMCFTAPAIFLIQGPASLDQLARFEHRNDRGGSREKYQARISFDKAATNGGRCEVVHIAMMVSDSGQIHRLLVEVKSILFYRQNPLHFHFLLYAKSREILSTIFKTWHLPDVNASFYSLSDVVGAMKWIPSTHGSLRYAVLKFNLAKVLPSSLKAVIVLDIDLMIASDIGKLWELVGHLQNENKMLGLVENQNDRYLSLTLETEEGDDLWPAIGRGYNSGVLLLNLEQLRATDWSKTWKSVLRDFEAYSEVPFSDEDVINVVLMKQEVPILVLPCVWNVQLTGMLSEYCTESVYDFKIVRWNPASKGYGSSPHFKSLYQMFKDFDSMLFATYYTNCTMSYDPGTANFNGKEDPCYEIRQESKLVRRVHPYYLNYSYQSTRDDDVTLVTHTSMDRLHMLESLLNHWDGPLSIALYASETELDELLAHVSFSRALKDTRKLALHVVSKAGKFYPYNQMRNIALDFVKTPYIYMIDIDFLPMYGLYEFARDSVRLLHDKKRALIVPAFETFHFEMDFPDDKSNLLFLLQEGIAFPFRIHAWKGGHAPTNFEYWKTAKRPYSVQWAKGFEPYFIMSSSVPRFDERFVGYGGDKISHVMELVTEGYELVVLPNAFMIHMPHPITRERTVFKQKTSQQNKCIRMLQREFKAEIQNAR